MKQILLPKIALILSLCLFVLAAVSIPLIYRKLTTSAEENVLSSLEVALTQTATTINDRMSAIEDTMRHVVYDANFQKSITLSEEQNTMDYQLKEIKNLRAMVSTALNRQDIRLVRIYLSDSKMLSREKLNFFPIKEAQDLPNYERLYNAHGSMVWQGPQVVKTSFFDGKVISLGSLIRSVKNYQQPNVLILLDVDPDYFGRVLSSFSMPDDRFSGILIVDQLGEVVAQKAAHPLEEGLFLEMNHMVENQGFIKSSEGQEYACLLASLQSGGWKMLFYTPRDSLVKSQRAFQHVLMILLVCVIILAVLLISLLVTSAYTNRVHLYLQGINQEILKSGVNRYMKKNDKDQGLFNLNSNIHQLLTTVDHLTQENYDIQLREREAKLRTLQEQINPHFLYNTLDSINWMTMRNQGEKASAMLGTLAAYFRMSLSKGESVVPLKREIEITKAYLSLYANRNDYEYRVLWKVDEQGPMEDFLIPKMTLQPLVENALLHGVFKRKQKQGGKIIIKATFEQNLLILSVEDNGPGFIEGEDRRGYGLNNIRERLALFTKGYGELVIKKGLKEGAVVEVVFHIVKP